MEKSKLGISVALFGALLYLMGASGSVLTIAVAAGYVLLYEESGALKRTALKALMLTIVLSLLATAINFVSATLVSSLSTLYTYTVQKSYSANNFKYTPNLYQILQYLPNSVNYLFRIIEIVIPVIFGVRAYRQRDIKIKWIDGILDKHLS